jgi:hypothetical protein
MGTQTLARKLTRLEVAARARDAARLATLARVRADPAALMALAGMEPDPWQAKLLRSSATRMLLLCSRQAGKSCVAASLALRTALLEPGSLTLLLSPSLRQSGELFLKVLAQYGALGRPVPPAAESALRLQLINGSRVVSLPGDEETIRGFSGVALLVIDEAARVQDALYCAVRPMLAVSRGRLVALSTPFGKRGWFHDEWHGDAAWERVRIDATQCPRIAADFLESERYSLGERWFRQEYLNSFEEAVGSVFSAAEIRAALVDDEPWTLGGIRG